MILIPLYWQVVRGESATTAGLLMAPTGIAAGIAIQISGRPIDRLPPIRVIGPGFTLMPTTTVATRSLENTAIPSGSTIISVISQVSGAMCTAAVSVLLASELSARLPGIANGGVGSLNALPPSELAVLAPQVADSFQAAFWLPVALMATAGVVALVVFRSTPTRQEAERLATPDAQSPLRGRASE